MANSKNTKKGATKSASKGKAKALEKASNSDLYLSVAIFAVSLLFFFIAVLTGEGVWFVLHNFYIGIFGWFAAIVLPLLCLVYSFLFTIRRTERKMTFEVVMIVLLVFFACTLIHCIGHQSGEDFVAAIGNARESATVTFNGGFIGAVFGWLFLTLGKAPAIVLNLLLILVDIILLSKATVNQFFTNTTKPVKRAVEKATPYIEERRERRRTRDIDVFLDDVPPGENGEKSKSRKKKTVQNKAETAENKDRQIIDVPLDLDEPYQLMQEAHEKKLSEAEKAKSGEEDIAEKTDKPAKATRKKRSTPVTKEAEMTVSENTGYQLPPKDLLTASPKKSTMESDRENREKGKMLTDTLKSFGVDATVINVSRGPTVTRYELKPAAGVRISKITNLSDDIALNLAATNVRIEAPIPGKAAVGIEIPNSVKNMVSMREVIDTDEFDRQKSLLSAAIGKDITGNTVFCDVAKMPHLLIAGTTGSGKSVCMNSIIVSILYRATPDDVKFLMIDPKKVEFSKYESIPHLLVPVVTDPRKASGALGWAVAEMLKRYQLFSDTGVRDIAGYNKYVEKHGDMEPLPKIVICIDELADLMMAAPKEVEDSICRLAQMARAAGMHLVIATQRPSVDVITGLIKANISSRIALTVSSAIDSRTILDSSGAEKLLGRGDMLYSPIGASKPLRVQGCFISDEEVENLCEFIKAQGVETDDETKLEISKEIESRAVQEKGSSNAFDDADGGENLDPLFENAVEVVLENGRASTSFLQRKLGVGYSRGSKIMDQLEEKGVIGPQDGAKPREIKINMTQWLQMKANGPVSDEPPFTAENTEQMSLEDTAFTEDSVSDEDEDVIDNKDYDDYE